MCAHHAALLRRAQPHRIFPLWQADGCFNTYMSRANMFRRMPFWQACNTLPCDIACPGEGRNSIACMARRMSRLDRLIALGAHHAVLLRCEHLGPGAVRASAWGKPRVAFTPTPVGLQTAASRPGGTQHSPHDSTGRWEDAQGRRGPPRTPDLSSPVRDSPTANCSPMLSSAPAAAARRPVRAHARFVPTLVHAAGLEPAEATTVREATSESRPNHPGRDSFIDFKVAPFIYLALSIVGCSCSYPSGTKFSTLHQHCCCTSSTARAVQSVIFKFSTRVLN
jgi:hypothetical protein